MFRKVLVANRAAVARRVIRALRELGIASVAVYSDADESLPYWKEADEAYRLGPPSPRESYLNQEAILRVAQESGADAVHPGYGFLSESADFAEAVEKAGLVFIGPKPALIRQLGHKTQARDLMQRHGMPMVRSSQVLSDASAVRAAAADIGYPLLIKPAGGGGGIGMLPLSAPDELDAKWEQARVLAERSFGQADLYLEQLLRAPRHIEFQFLADRHGAVKCLFERDCSVQRRHQKVIEEAPAPGLDRRLINTMAARLESILQAIGYDVIGTVEMLYTPEVGFVFLEVNTRLQVEHAITEAVTGVDLVHAQIRLAAGERLSDVLPAAVTLNGHAIEARIYAEDPLRFIPSPGMLKVFESPRHDSLRVETGYCGGVRVSSHYDPLLAKLIAHGATREAAIDNLSRGLGDFRIEGIKHNIPFIQRVLSHPDFLAGRLSTDMTAQVQSVAQAA